MTKEERAHLRALANAATPGPWRNVDLGSGEACVMAEHTAITDGTPNGEVSRDDAAFIAAARNAIVPLLDALEAAESDAAKLREALEEALEEWDAASHHKGSYLRDKDDDAARIAEMRKRFGLGGGT